MSTYMLGRWMRVGLGLAPPPLGHLTATVLRVRSRPRRVRLRHHQDTMAPDVSVIAPGLTLDVSAGCARPTRVRRTPGRGAVPPGRSPNLARGRSPAVRARC